MGGLIAILLEILKGLVPLAIQMWRGAPPSPVVQEAEKAGAAEQALNTEKQDVDQVSAAAAAAVRASGDVASDDGLRKYEAADPNNRDNAG